MGLVDINNGQASAVAVAAAGWAAVAVSIGEVTTIIQTLYSYFT
jgi:hypothetical protein